MKNDIIRSLKLTIICFGFCILYACSTQKDTIPSRAMQNLTAKYNYLYHANLLLKRHEDALNQRYTFDDQQILPVYQIVATSAEESKELDLVIAKSRTVIAEKSYSKHIGDTYLLLATAYFYKSNYFLAQEYAAYVERTYPTHPSRYSKALDLKARSLGQLGKNTAAQPVLDSLEASLSRLKKHKALHLATLAQSKISSKKYVAAISYLEAALKEGAQPLQEIRWNYILGQLFQAEKNFPKALACYRKVERRNAAYELAFHATLNSIKLKNLTNDAKNDLQKQLLAMLNADKNEDFKDQIYHQLAWAAAEKSNFSAAIKYEQQALQFNKNNPAQQRLSYLNLSELEDKHFKNYQQAALYHDSALVDLPENYPAYNSLRQKNKQLHFLAEQYTKIRAEEKLLDTAFQTQSLSAAALATSKEKLFKRYANLANFYTYELKDVQEASAIYQILNTRFPSALLAANRNLMAEKSKAKQRAAQLFNYHQVYDAYEKKEYQKVIDTVNTLLLSKAPQHFPAQLAYLKALAIGRLYPVDSLISALKYNSKVFEEDSLIGPLVKQHLDYIQQHLVDLKNRKVAILPADSMVGLQQDLPETPLKALPLPVTKTEDRIAKPGEKVEMQESIFSNLPSSTYYFVIAVNDASINLNSSRFGVGQFNRGNYADRELRHRILEFDNYQLIYVGNFSNYEETKIYAAGIIPQLQKIMKVAANRYHTFISSKENLEKIDHTAVLNKYFEYYKHNFENE